MERSRLVCIRSVIFTQPAHLATELQRVLSVDPGQQVVDDFGRPLGPVLTIEAGTAAESLVAVVKTDRGRARVAGHSRNLGTGWQTYCQSRHTPRSCPDTRWPGGS